MLNSVKKIRASRDRKINILTLVLSEKKILNETKNRNPPSPLQVKWSDPYLTFDLNKIGPPTATRGVVFMFGRSVVFSGNSSFLHQKN
jgi:hypothetical protein